MRNKQVIMDRFYSKRNIVSKSDHSVIKTFTEKTHFIKELSVYKTLLANGFVKMPNLMDVDERNCTLSLEYINGTLLVDCIEQAEKNGDVNSAYMCLSHLIKWLDDFYMSFDLDNQIMGDINFRNFIWNQGTLYGYDFECVTSGDQAKERMDVLAWYMMYNPIETEFKKTVVTLLANEHYKNSEKVYENLDLSIREIKERRRKK